MIRLIACLLLILVVCAFIKLPTKEHFKDNYDIAFELINPDSNKGFNQIMSIPPLPIKVQPADSTFKNTNGSKLNFNSNSKDSSNQNNNLVVEEEQCAFCDCAKLQAEIANECSTYQIALSKCNIQVLELSGACQAEKNIIINNANTEKASLTKQNNDLQAANGTMQMALTQFKQDNKELFDRNKTLMSDNLDLRKNIYAYQKQIYECLRPQKPTCRTAQTTFGPDLGGEGGEGGGLFWMQLHNIACDERENLQKWHLVRDNESKNVAINYTCCKMEASGEPYPNTDLTKIPPELNATTEKETKNNYPTTATS